uniref:phospholipase A2 n=1 Tax=Amphimedon queenslandica TaxID=400682 RepID=A0A1X7VUZ6_AMPQE
MEAKSIDYYHNLTLELLFENGTKLKPDYLYGEARETKLASVNGLAETATAAYVIILKANGDNWFLLYEGDEVTEETLHSLDDDLSELLNIDIKITVDLLNVFLQPEPDERLVERMMLEISKVWYLNFLRNGHEMTDGSEDYESDDKYDFVPVVITKQVENKFWEEAFCGPFHSENVPFPSAEQAEGIAAKLLKIDNSYSASISIIEAVEQGTYRSMSFALQLLLFGINPNQCKPSNGDTALHIAVRKDNEVMVKLLLAFKADLNIKNKTGKTPTDLAADKEKISHLDLTEVAEWQDKMKEHFASYPNLPERTRTGTYLMSLDGGGICGFNSITFLIALEDRMKELSPKCHPIHHYFDYIAAGTSFGAIAALSFLYTNHSLRIGRCLVYQILVKVISFNSIYIEKMMKKCLKRIFEERVMSSLKGPPHAIVTTTEYRNKKLCLITSYGSNSETGSTDHQVWKAAFMSSAAPVIVPPVDGKYYDGGLLANNPTHVALGEISKIEQNCEFGCVLSIGTGSFEDPDIVDRLQYLAWNVPFGRICTKPISSTKSFKLLTEFSKKEKSEQAARSLCNEKGWKYHRWSPFLSKNLGLACTDLNVIIDMMYHTEMYILQNPETIDDIAKCILAKKLAN